MMHELFSYCSSVGVIGICRIVATDVMSSHVTFEDVVILFVLPLGSSLSLFNSNICAEALAALRHCAYLEDQTWSTHFSLSYFGSTPST